ncbi:MAG: outer membrane lipoprotein chaperone LolA [Gammaproteobacteria bacterium]|nr:outer membrane lipoprotein chaperone LolA [Gammaproteobacteria bacterium]
MTGKNIVLAAVLAISLAGNTVHAQARVDEVGEKLVSAFVNDVITLQGRFEQSLVDAAGVVIERSSGTLEIERPGRFHWAYAEPYEQLLVADGLNIWSYDVDLAQVTVKPQAQALANTPALLLGGSEDALSQFRFDGSMVEEGTTWVRMIPIDTRSGFERMELGFSDGQLTRMVFFDNLEQRTLVALHDVTTNEPIDGERFEFTVPEDADLVGVPVMAEESSP